MNEVQQFNINGQLKRTFKDSLIYLPTRVIPAIIGILLIRILTTAFSPKEYGHYQIALSTFGLIRVFSTIWLSTSVTRFFLSHRKINQENIFFSTLFVCSIISAMSVSLLGLLINAMVFKTRLEPVLFSLINLAIVASIFNSFFEIFVVIFRAGLEAKKYSLYWILFSIGKPLIGVGLIVVFGFKGDGIFWGFLVIPLILNILILSRLNFHKTFSIKIFSKQLIQQFAKYGIPITFSFLAFWILSLSDRYLIEFFRDSSEVGLYSVGYAISEKTLNFVYTVLMLAAFPIIIDNWENHGKEKTQLLITELTRYFFLICTPILVVLICLPKNILMLFSSGKFIQGASVLPLIATGIFFNGLNQYVLKGFELTKKSYKIAALASAAGFTNIVLNIILIPKYGFLGAGISATSAYIIYFSLATFFVRTEMAWKPPGKAILNILIAAAILAIYLVKTALIVKNSLFIIFLIIPSGIFIFTMILILIGEVKTRELKKGWQFILGLSRR